MTQLFTDYSSCHAIYESLVGIQRYLCRHANHYRRGLGETQIKAGITIDHATKKDKDGNPENAPKYGLHSPRHFHASWLINRKQDGGLKLPSKNVQKRMGHSSIQVALDLYGHLFPSDDDHLAELDAAQASLLA
jgi:integrase